MFRGEQIQHIQMEGRRIQGNTKIYLVRHGEVKRQPGHEPILTEKGDEQAREVARSVFPYIQERITKGIGVNICILYARMDRTAEMAKGIEKECRKIVKESNINNVIIFRPAASPLLEAANSIEPIIKAGASKQQAIMLWLVSDERVLAKIGVKTFPSKVHKNLNRLINGSDNLDKRWGETRDNLVFWVTQETVQAALLFYLSHKEPIAIDYAERIEIVPINSENKVRFRFREKQFYANSISAN